MKLEELVDLTAADTYKHQEAFITALSPTAHMLIGTSLGLTGEAGEFAELVKKHVYQGKELNRDHLIKELGDVLWYVGLGCITLGISQDEVQSILEKKLLARYTDGKFNVEQSNNRKESDV